MDTKNYKLEFYAPPKYIETVKQAIFAAGAGAIGDYDCCCWETTGTGQFRPLPHSNPFIGKQGEVATTPEVKVEVICPAAVMSEIIKALKQAHPYETPAFQYWPVWTGQNAE